MTRLALLGALALLASAATSGIAQQHRLFLQVSGGKGPVKGVWFSLSGQSSVSRPTDDFGKTEILLASDVKVGTSVELLVLPREYRLVSPLNRRAVVPSFDSASVVSLVVYKVGDRIENEGDVIIFAGRTALADISRVIGQKPTEQQLKANRERAASEAGSSPEALKRKIQLFSTTDPYELGVIALCEGRYVEAEKQLSLALDKLTDARAAPEKVLNAALFLGNARYMLGDYRQAAKAYGQASAVVSGDPGLLNSTAMALEKIGDLSGAETQLRRALEIREREIGDKISEDLAVALTNLGFILNERYKCAEAKGYVLRALTIWQKTLADSDIRLATAYRNVGETFYCVRDYGGASQYFEQELTVWERVMGPGHPSFANKLYEYGMKMYKAEEYALAEPPMKRALAIWERKSPDGGDFIWTSIYLARIKARSKDFSAAEQFYSSALKEAEAKENGSLQITILKDLIDLAEEKSDFANAERWQHRILAIFTGEPPSASRDRNIAISRHNEAYFVYKQGDYGRAEPLLKEALTVNQRAFGPDSESVRNIRRYLDNIPRVSADRIKPP